MKKILLILAIILLTSCATTVYTPKGYYDDNYNYPNYQYGLRYLNYDSHLYYYQPVKVYIYIPKNNILKNASKK
jgi:uncharacterized protein YceK